MREIVTLVMPRYFLLPCASAQIAPFEEDVSRLDGSFRTQIGYVYMVITTDSRLTELLYK